MPIYYAPMEITLFPNPRRPGIGLRPKKEAQRPLLPQHARLCPVLEAGSSLGALVYPSLAPNEQFSIRWNHAGLACVNERKASASAHRGPRPSVSEGAGPEHQRAGPAPQDGNEREPGQQALRNAQEGM